MADNHEFYQYNSNDFDTIIGHIEDMLIEENFHAVVSNFMEKHWQTFEHTEENKLVYTDIFAEYTHLVEEYMSSYLIKKIIGFSMKQFLEELEKQRHNLDGEIFDILLTMSDFLKFKEFILDFRDTKEGSVANLVLQNSITL